MTIMVRTQPKFEWLIRGYDSTKLIFETRVGSGVLSVHQIKALLKTLTAKAGLTFDEIVGAYVKRKTKRCNVHLEVHDDAKHFQIWCGSNPHFVAKLERVKVEAHSGSRHSAQKVEDKEP